MRSTIYRFGIYSSIAAFFAAAGYGVVQILQVLNIIGAPLDGILIYGFSLCIAIPFLIALIALHCSIQNEKRFWTVIAIAFAAIYVTYVTLMYVVQLALVIPATHPTATSDILIVSPHSLFWILDGLGYIFMGLAAFFVAFVFAGNKNERWLKWFFLAHGLLTPVISFVYFYPHFSIPLLFLGTPWIITASGSMLLLFRYFIKESSMANE